MAEDDDSSADPVPIDQQEEGKDDEPAATPSTDEPVCYSLLI